MFYAAKHIDILRRGQSEWTSMLKTVCVDVFE